METRKKKTLSNVIMIALIAVVIICGIMAVGITKGWFGGDDSPVASGETKGLVNVERNGIGYTLDENVPIKTGDIIETKRGSQAELKIAKKNKTLLNEKTEIAFSECETDNVSIEIPAGEMFADMPKAPETMHVSFAGNTAKITGTVFSVSVQTGSSTLNVFEGEVEVDASDGSTQIVKAGEALSIAETSGGEAEVEISALEAAALNEFILTAAQECDSRDKLCFTQKQLQEVLDARAEESAQAKDAQGNTITAEEDKTTKNTNSSDGADGGSSGNASSEGTANSGNVNTCTIQIRCDTILKNMENLADGKDRYVPANGIILATSSVQFADGETVFDVLKRACSYAGIHLEYSWTPMYDSYYIEGINHLYEFDCGEQSGWMYKVNGWFPNYGCSDYELKDGDVIVWTYTCNGLGADVGGNVR